MSNTRRGKRRKRKELKQQKEIENLSKLASLQNLYNAALQSFRLVFWKQSIQRFRLSLLFRIHQARKDILNGKDIRQGFICFRIFERGKKREIQSLHFYERFIQKWLCKYVLLPKFGNTLIKENSASQKGKGTTFASKTLEKHLREFLIKHNTGYILTVDFSKYFENIKHEPLIQFYNDNFQDERLKNLLIKAITAYEKGLGLGSEVSQFNAIIYINKIDHFVKNHYKYYGRYMDDSYIISENKEKLQEFTKVLFKKYEEMGIVLNFKKTRIVPLTQYFTFLKTRYKIDGKKIIKKPCRSSITRARRRYKGMIKLYKKGVMSKDEISRSFVSTKGSMKRRNARRSMYKLEKEVLSDIFI